MRCFRSARTLGTLAVAVIGFGGATHVYADPIQSQMTYSTSGTVESAGVKGTGSVSFQGVSDGSLTTGSKFDLGHFVVSPAQDGSNTTYTQTPFDISLNIHSVDGSTSKITETPIIVQGWLNGSMNFSAVGNIIINYNSVNIIPEAGPPFPTTVQPFQIGDFTGYLNVNLGNVYADGQPLVAELNLVQTVPEPGTLAIFACIAGFFVIQRRHRSTRA
jgi:hypothetical protein